jgi:prepilin-type N-terminal cleavage/methylation domain-containing protein/prepilin-type processing-associated H-X9-DG protein
MRPRRAFTLVELLTVIAVVGVLAGLLVPVVGAVRAKARSTTCASNLRQVGVATWLYLRDQKDRLPSNSHERDEFGQSLSWTRTLAPYLGPAFIGRCPARPDHLAAVTYGWNDWLNHPATGKGVSLATCRQPSATLLLGELTDTGLAEHLHFRGAARGVTPAYFRTQVGTTVHGAGANYLFVDGHVANLAPADVDRRLVAPNSPFITP